MRQQRVGAVVLLGAAVLLLVPATSSAQVRFGMGRFGGYYGGYGGYYGYSPGTMYGYSPYGGYYGGAYYPSYSTYGSWSYPGSTYPGYASSYYSSPETYYSNRPGTSSDTGSYSYGAPASTTERDAARLNVRLPDANAEVWVEGQRTQQRGTTREYISPPLNPDKNYIYEVRARWTENGQEKERTKTVSVRANGTATVDFTTATSSRVDDIDRDGRGKDDRARPRSEPGPGDSKPGTKTRPPDNPPPD
jgi:uncharacterized protein (TIGR03000 family)